MRSRQNPAWSSLTTPISEWRTAGFSLRGHCRDPSPHLVLVTRPRAVGTRSPPSHFVRAPASPCSLRFGAFPGWSRSPSPESAWIRTCGVGGASGQGAARLPSHHRRRGTVADPRGAPGMLAVADAFRRTVLTAFRTELLAAVRSRPDLVCPSRSLTVLPRCSQSCPITATSFPGLPTTLGRLRRTCGASFGSCPDHGLTDEQDVSSASAPTARRRHPRQRVP